MLAGEIIGFVASGWGSGLGSIMILETRLGSMADRESR